MGMIKKYRKKFLIIKEKPNPIDENSIISLTFLKITSKIIEVD